MKKVKHKQEALNIKYKGDYQKNIQTNLKIFK